MSFRRGVARGIGVGIGAAGCWGWRGRWLPAGLALLALGGCQRGFFASTGYVESGGGVLGNWRSAPQGCSRDPLDGRPPGQTATVVTFLWEDPSMHDPKRDKNRARAPDAPVRLEIAREGGGYSATFATVRHAGVRAMGAQCSEFTVETREEAPVVAGALPALGGRVRLACAVGGGQVRADLRFTRCEF